MTATPLEVSCLPFFHHDPNFAYLKPWACSHAGSGTIGCDRSAGRMVRWPHGSPPLPNRGNTFRVTYQVYRIKLLI
jgi:hypothetical protein